MRIASVETRRYVFPFEPPLSVAWDPVPRVRQEATVVIVRSDEGLEGCASGDALPDRELLEQLLVGLDPLRTEVVRELCETVDFHHGRPWTVETAVWDLAGRALDVPCWRLLGGRSERLLAYASSAEPVATEERVARVLALRDAGIRAVKLRLPPGDWRAGVALVEAVRDAAGADLELMVDANQGWRMPGDREARWDVATAAQCARALEPLRVYWLEEPLPTDDVEGYRALRTRTDLRLAAGEMVRGAHEARDLIVRGGVDVIQTDVVPRTRGRTATGSSQTCISRSPSPRVRLWRCRMTRPGSRRSAATGCSPTPSRSRRTARSHRPRAQASASCPTSTPSSSGGWRENGRLPHRGRRTPRGARR